MKSVWWPIAHNRSTAVPVWDPEMNPARTGGNGYMTWKRVVWVEPSPVARSRRRAHSLSPANTVPLQRLYHVVVDQTLAKRVMNDSGGRKVAAIALGREIRPGDYLALVAVNLATRELPHWIWGALWWHDKPSRGDFGMDRPVEVRGVWRNYLMQVSFDSKAPAEPNGTPHICFNPWLEGRFPDGGKGGGTVSNCLSCHERASYPSVDFLPVTRDSGSRGSDPAFDVGRLRTSFLWGLPMHAVH
jgi:hypothetical protein